MRSVVASAWVLAVVIATMQGAGHHVNNFEIFRTAWDNLAAGRDLYAPSARHVDLFKYSPTFALLMAPFAMLPFAAGLFAWNAVNAGALYASLALLFRDEALLVARAIVFFEMIGSIQNAQSNALVAALMIVPFVGIASVGSSGVEGHRRDGLAGEIGRGTSVAIGAFIKVFPLASLSAAVFRARWWRTVAIAVACIVVLGLAPLLVISPAMLVAEYRSWLAVEHVDALDRGFSVMRQMQLWLGYSGPNWPVQAAGTLALVAPLLAGRWTTAPTEITAAFAIRYLASLLVFAVIFNHQSERPSFVIAVAGVAIWFAASERTRVTWSLLTLVVIGTILPSSAAMPRAGRVLFAHYALKAVPCIVVWLVIQTDIWRRALARRPSPPTPART